VWGEDRRRASFSLPFFLGMRERGGNCKAGTEWNLFEPNTVETCLAIPVAIVGSFQCLMGHFGQWAHSHLNC
jgi:hypothetical protein